MNRVEKTKYFLYLKTITNSFFKMQESIEKDLFIVIWDDSMDSKWNKKTFKKNDNIKSKINLVQFYNTKIALKYVKFNLLTFIS